MSLDSRIQGGGVRGPEMAIVVVVATVFLPSSRNGGPCCRKMEEKGGHLRYYYSTGPIGQMMMASLDTLASLLASTLLAAASAPSFRCATVLAEQKRTICAVLTAFRFRPQFVRQPAQGYKQSKRILSVRSWSQRSSRVTISPRGTAWISSCAI